MLDTLHIENIAVVREADLDFPTGLTVLTGETGAGKSIIIDSINLLLGARPQRELIRTGENTALVSAVFSDIGAELAEMMRNAGLRTEEDGSVLLQRTVSLDGKAATRINGRPLTVSMQKELAAQLISIHGQHDNQVFLKPESHIFFLDSYAGIDTELSAYGVLYTEYRELRAKLKALSRDEQEKARLAELLRYQINDIDSGHLKAGEEEQLLQRRDKIRNAEKIAKYAKNVYRALYRSEKSYSASEQLDRAVSALEQMTEFFPKAAEYAEKLSGFRYEIEDIAEAVEGLLSGEDDDPTALLDKLEGRLETISRLKKKYGATVEDVLAFRKKSAEELEEITLSDEKITELNEQLAKLKKELDRAAAVLTEKRRAAGKELSAHIMEELAFLDMEKVRFSVNVHACEDVGYTARGRDCVEFLISTNPGEPLKPLDRIASGGELSRIMLAAKCVTAKSEKVRTMIFDEVDTGVSGKTSQKIGLKLRELGRSGCQVLCVTHSAQIAALADRHLFISKHETGGRTETTVTPLDREGRIREIARIIGGIELTDSVLAAAEEMLDSGTSAT